MTFFYLLIHRSEQARVQLARSGVLLAKSEQAYRSVVTNMVDIFFRTDASGVFTMLSPSAASVLGYKDADALIGNKIDDVFLTCGQQDPLLEQLKISGSVYDLEFKAKCENQTLIDMSISANLVLNAANEPEGFEGIARDIGERKKAQKQQQEVQLLLQHAQKMETVGTLAGGVAHDLNNILSGIVSYPDLVLMQIAEDSPIRESIETIKESGLKAAVIVQDLLTLARRGVSSQHLVNLNDLIAAHLKSPEFSKMLSFHPNITVKTELDTNLLPIMGSPVHFTKTLMNLVFNAAESMVGGGQISIGTRNCYLDRPVTGYGGVKEGEYAVLTVADNGVGIAKEDQMRIFEPFYTKKTMGRSGTGLGMAVVWGTVKDHNGYIDLESKQGVGTLFTLYFPITRDLPAADKIESCATADRGSGQTILVVDDIKEQREIASAILTSLNYRVKTVCSGEEAVAYLIDNRVDLIVLDMIMAPGMSGLETYQKIIAHRPGQKAIISSGYSETDDIKKAQQLGAGGYLKKPYTITELASAVKNELLRTDCAKNHMLIKQDAMSLASSKCFITADVFIPL
jgi:two-component system, cell cycle sensor histidine kinase and response regulator CckA